MQNKFSVVTVLTHETPNYFTLRKSAERFGWPLAAKFVEPSNHNDFLRNKHLHIKQFLYELDLSDFLYVDAFDTVFIGPNPYGNDWGQKLTFAGEKNCYPQESYASEFDKREGVGPFPYLNSGIIWGSAFQYRWLCPEYKEHDQLVWTRKAIEDRSIQINSYGTIGLNLHSTDEDDFEKVDGVWRYKPTGACPVVLHGNGMWPIPSWAMRGE